MFLKHKLLEIMDMLSILLWALALRLVSFLNGFGIFLNAPTELILWLDWGDISCFDCTIVVVIKAFSRRTTMVGKLYEFFWSFKSVHSQILKYVVVFQFIVITHILSSLSCPYSMKGPQSV